MYKTIYDYLQLPKVYAANTSNFWNDEHISKQMLKAHLDPDYEGASRKRGFIDKSVEWIAAAMPVCKYGKMLDVGCGPGLYAERFCRLGYNVTGIDFSRRSIEYARKNAQKHGLAITYLYQDYLQMDIDAVFDFAVFIYCDYGALSDVNRTLVLNNIYRALKPQGKLLLDVFSKVKYDAFEETAKWAFHPDGGFWSNAPYLSLERGAKYPDYITLEQSIILSEKSADNYYIWNTCFTAENLKKEAERAGFKVCEVFSDVAGAPYNTNSPTIAILLEK